MAGGPWSGRHVNLWLFPSNLLQLPCSLVRGRQQAISQPLATTSAFNSSTQKEALSKDSQAPWEPRPWQDEVQAAPGSQLCSLKPAWILHAPFD